MGADFIEPDLVITKDRVLIARHEPEIGGTTDVASRPEFASRRTTKVIDGVTFHRLVHRGFHPRRDQDPRAVERIPAQRQENTVFNGLFEVPTLEEVLRLRERLVQVSCAVDPIGVYPETKHPTYFQSIGLALEPPLVSPLLRPTLRPGQAQRAVFVQSFEDGQPARARRDDRRAASCSSTARSGSRTTSSAAGDPRTYADLATPAGLAEVGDVRRRHRPAEGHGRARRRRRHARRRPRRWWPTPIARA